MLRHTLNQVCKRSCLRQGGSYVLQEELHLSRLIRSFSSEDATLQKVGRLNHVAIAVPDLQKAAERYRHVLGAKVSEPQDVTEHGVTVVFVELPNTKLELMHPLGADSPIAKFLERNPAGGLHHICLEVENIRQSMTYIKSTGDVRILSSEPTLGAHGSPVAFLHPKDMDGVLTELEEVRGITSVIGQSTWRPAPDGLSHG